MQNEIRYFSMFTGVGGFELGLENAGSKSNISGGWDKNSRSSQSLQSERDKPCDETSSSNPITQPENERPEERGEWSSDEQGTLFHDRQYPSFTCVGCSEIDKYSSQVLAERFPNIKNWGDCTKINPDELPDFDMLCGGFPCQAFSIAGKRRGFEDTRGTMFFEVARILEVKRPKIVLLENVKGLLNHDKGKTFTVILETLDELGYETQWMVLNSKFFGVPQNRERVFIIGNIRGERRPEILPFRYSCKEAVGPREIQEQVASTLTTAEMKVGSGMNMIQEPKIGIAIQGSQAQRVYTTELAPTLKGLGEGQGAKTGLYAIPVLTPDRPEKRQNGRRFKEDGEPSFTLTGQDIYGVTDEFRIRRLTPTECCRLQGFPDNWNEMMSDTQRYKQMGNAVTVNVIKAIGERLI